MRIITANVKANVKTNSIDENLVTGSRNTMPIIRGVNCALASCTATKSAEHTNTINVNIDEASVPSTARAVSGSIVDSQPSAASSMCSSRAATSATTMLANGKIQKES